MSVKQQTQSAGGDDTSRPFFYLTDSIFKSNASGGIYIQSL